jgi:hypothetical protein
MGWQSEKNFLSQDLASIWASLSKSNGIKKQAQHFGGIVVTPNASPWSSFSPHTLSVEGNNTTKRLKIHKVIGVLNSDNLNEFLNNWGEYFALSVSYNVSSGTYPLKPNHDSTNAFEFGMNPAFTIPFKLIKLNVVNIGNGAYFESEEPADIWNQNGFGQQVPMIGPIIKHSNHGSQIDALFTWYTFYEEFAII